MGAKCCEGKGMVLLVYITQLANLLYRAQGTLPRVSSIQDETKMKSSIGIN